MIFRSKKPLILDVIVIVIGNFVIVTPVCVPLSFSLCTVTYFPVSGELHLRFVTLS